MPTNLVWATSFNREMYAATGIHLLRSFAATRSEGVLLACTEQLDVQMAPPFVVYNLDQDQLLHDFLTANKDIIPEELGGLLGRCSCPHPDNPHAKDHKPRCPRHWFQKHSSRWFRKFCALKRALTLPIPVDMVVWIDSDCVFQRYTSVATVLDWFKGRAVFYTKSKDRKVIESGIIGFHLHRGGRPFIEGVIDRYRSGAFRKDFRWDDSAQFTLAVGRYPNIPSIDLATHAGAHSEVVQNSPIGPFIRHFKGRHGRGLGIMT